MHKPIRAHLPKHPSGQPIASYRIKRYTSPRPVQDEPLTPGLRKDCCTEAIGFGHEFPSSDYEDVEEV